MAIDIKELRIGNHIIANGVKCEIKGLDMFEWAERKRPHGIFGAIISGEYRECGSFLDVAEIEPISITTPLLSNLEFSYIKSSDSWIKSITKDDNIFLTQDGDCWKINLYPSEYRHTMVAFCKYLHELENIYYNVFKKELV